MIDNNINRFCELILTINTMNKALDEKRKNDYPGLSFEEYVEEEIKEICNLQNELKGVLKNILRDE